MEKKKYIIFDLINFNFFIEVLCISVFLSIPELHAQDISFDYITNENGLSNNTVYDICQDENGFMWFATENGLNRYDGQNVKQYHSDSNSNSLPSNSIRSIAYTDDNKLFLGTFEGLAVYVPEKDNFKRLDQGNASLNDIIQIKQGFGKEILISTEGSELFIYNYEKNVLKKISFINERVYGFTTDKEGYYWAYSRFTLYRFNKQLELIKTYPVDGGNIKTPFSLIKSDSKGNLWIGTFQNGIFKFDFETQKLVPFILDDMNFVRTMEEDLDPDLYWVGTEKGLYLVNIKTKELKHQTQSFDNELRTLNDNAIYKIFRNRQNVLFF